MDLLRNGWLPQFPGSLPIYSGRLVYLSPISLYHSSPPYPSTRPLIPPRKYTNSHPSSIYTPRSYFSRSSTLSLSVPQNHANHALNCRAETLAYLQDWSRWSTPLNEGHELGLDRHAMNPEVIFLLRSMTSHSGSRAGRSLLPRDPVSTATLNPTARCGSPAIAPRLSSQACLGSVYFAAVAADNNIFCPAATPC